MKPIKFALDLSATDAESNYLGFTWIDILKFNYDGKGSALANTQWGTMTLADADLEFVLNTEYYQVISESFTKPYIVDVNHDDMDDTFERLKILSSYDAFEIAKEHLTEPTLASHITSIGYQNRVLYLEVNSGWIKVSTKSEIPQKLR